MKSLNDIGPEASAPTQWAVLRTPTPDHLGDELKQMFGNLTAGPLPDRMVQLADALEEAFRRGELFDPDSRRAS